jgi:hypothetical protein
LRLRGWVVLAVIEWLKFTAILCSSRFLPEPQCDELGCVGNIRDRVSPARLVNEFDHVPARMLCAGRERFNHCADRPASQAVFVQIYQQGYDI